MKNVNFIIEFSVTTELIFYALFHTLNVKRKCEYRYTYMII